MNAADSSSLIAYLTGDNGPDVARIEVELANGTLFLPPVVITELSSDPKNGATLAVLLGQCPLLDITPGYWERAGRIRARLLAKRLRAKIPDTLIAQSCLDHDVPLITRNTDFRHFAEHCGLKLA